MDKIDGTSEEDEDEEMAVAMEVKEEEEDDDDEDADDGVAAMRRASQQLLHHHHQPLLAGARRSRPKEEKERTKLRERHRRAITARILAGLRRHGNYNLRVRADINDVIAALAREAGWVVLPDGTTFPSRSGKPSPLPPPPPQSPAPLRGIPSTCNSSRLPRMKSVYLPPDTPRPSFPPDGADDKPLATAPERDFAGTPYVPIYVALPLGVVDANCELSDPVGISKQLRMLKSINVDGIVVDCWWGIVEAHSPQQYNWTGYKHLFAIVRELKLKIRVAMSFHECAADGACIPLPQWVVEIGTSNLDIFFTDREGRRNSECLSWGIDKERALRGRTAVEVYFDYMRSFRVEFDEFFDDGIISGIQIGLGPCGELRYPSCTTKHGWSYPGIGEFQCYDQYLLKSLRRAAEARGHSFWARGPDNAGAYISQPHETGFFCDGGEYDGYYGRFFLGWYSTVLVVHGDRVLSLAKLAFEGTPIFAKVSGIHWWYRTASHAAELTAGFYNPCNRDGYAAIAAMLKKHDAVLNFTCAASLRMSEDFQEGLADPEGLVWQVLNAAWDVDIPVASENPLPCHDRDGYNKILENAKPYNDPDGRHLSAFTYLRLGPVLTERHNFLEFQRFVKRMHGEAVLDLQV